MGVLAFLCAGSFVGGRDVRPRCPEAAPTCHLLVRWQVKVWPQCTQPSPIKPPPATELPLYPLVPWLHAVTCAAQRTTCLATTRRPPTEPNQLPACPPFPHPAPAALHRGPPVWRQGEVCDGCLPRQAGRAPGLAGGAEAQVSCPPVSCALCSFMLLWAGSWPVPCSAVRSAVL